MSRGGSVHNGEFQKHGRLAYIKRGCCGAILVSCEQERRASEHPRTRTTSETRVPLLELLWPEITLVFFLLGCLCIRPSVMAGRGAISRGELRGRSLCCLCCVIYIVHTYISYVSLNVSLPPISISKAAVNQCFCSARLAPFPSTAGEMIRI